MVMQGVALHEKLERSLNSRGEATAYCMYIEIIMRGGYSLDAEFTLRKVEVDEACRRL